MTASKPTVLVVEDEPLIRFALVDGLEDEGYDVIAAGTVLEAVARLSKHHVDAVVTDVDMPGGLSGLDLVDMISGLSRPIGIVVTSGRELPPGAELPSGAVFIPKPYAMDAVIAELERRVRAKPLALAS